MKLGANEVGMRRQLEDLSKHSKKTKSASEHRCQCRESSEGSIKLYSVYFKDQRVKLYMEVLKLSTGIGVVEEVSCGTFERRVPQSGPQSIRRTSPQ